MTHSTNLTNRELLQNAMPLLSLSRTQWNELMKYIEIVEQETGVESTIYKALEIIVTNQTKIEVINNYCFYYHSDLDQPVAKDNLEFNLS